METGTVVKGTDKIGHYEVYRDGSFVERVYATPYSVHSRLLTPADRTAVIMKASHDYKMKM